MYERFFNLRERPFSLSPDPEYLYLSRVHRDALDAIRYGIESRAGFIVVTGEIGAGKTTLLQTLVRQLDDRTVVARIVNTALEPRELLETILLDFGLSTADKSKPALLRDLGAFLVAQRAQGHRPLLVIDEAQNLSPAALEEVRLLSNLETEKSKLLQILVAGQPNLRETLATPALEQFRQRVAVSYHLTPLDAADTAAYINYRLEHASIGRPLRFPPEAADVVFRRSGGVPRIINVICNAALLFGYAEERRTIDRALVEDAVAELEASGVLLTATGIDTPTPGQKPEPHPAPAVAASPVDATMEARQAAPRSVPILAQPDAIDTAELLRERELLNRRLQEFAAREEELARRERQIAEQRRIMYEEYRLLRGGRQAPAASPRHPDGGGTWNGRFAMPRPAPRAYEARPGPAAPVDARRQQASFWQRISRLFGRAGGVAALRS